MRMRFLVAGALAAGLLMTVGAAGPAAAISVTKPNVPIPGVTLVKGGHGMHMGQMGRMGSGPRMGHAFHFHGYGGGPRIGHRGHFGRGVRFYPGFYGYAPYYDSYYYDDYYAYSDDCGWLRRKALRTNSRYWWRRYHACRDSY
jgi:hypothetical protein